MSNKPTKIDVLGVGISVSNMDDALQRIRHWISAGEQSYVCVCPNELIMAGQKDEEFRRILNGASMATPDGMSVVLACRILGHKEIEQVRGTDLMLRACNMAAQEKYSVFLYGATEDVLEKLSENLTQRFPKLEIAGAYAPPFRPLTEQESGGIIRMINAANPDILWIGLGGIKQERWMAHYTNHIQVPVMIGVGAAFDFISGNKQEAPVWARKAGLEWFFRLTKEPKRLWKRNLHHPVFIGKVVMQKWFR